MTKYPMTIVTLASFSNSQFRSLAGGACKTVRYEAEPRNESDWEGLSFVVSESGDPRGSYS